MHVVMSKVYPVLGRVRQISKYRDIVRVPVHGALQE